jgi:hypothetical protein
VSEHETIRLDFFEVYEEGSDFPLFVTSDPSAAREGRVETDRVVRRWWVREGGSDV